MDVRTGLQQLRKELNMRQVDLSRELGVSVVTLNRWETGKNKPSRAMSLAILSVANNLGASTVCQASLKDALMPAPEAPKLDDVRGAELSQINKLVNDFSNAIIISDVKTHEILYVNQQMSVVTGRPIEQASTMKCHEYLFGKGHPCKFCDVCSFSRKEYTTGEYESPRTGRFYVSRGKQITWDEKKANIEYITDITEFKKTNDELVRNRQLMAQACREAGIWAFTFDIPSGTTFLDSPVQAALNLPEQVPDFFALVVEKGDFASHMKEKIKHIPARLKSGESPIVLELQTNLASEKVHWVRLRINITDYTTDGKPLTAVCSAQNIDKEKAVEVRIRFEHERVIDSRKDLMGYVISDITQNRVMESRRLMDRGPNTPIDTPYDAAIQDALFRIEPDEDKALFIEGHQREYLLHLFEQGHLEQNLEYQLLQPDGTRIWVHTEMKLMLHPETGNILLYEYCYAVHIRKILKGLLRTIFRNGYDTVAAISLENDQVARLQLSENGELKEQPVLFASYMKETQAYCTRYVVPEERDGFLQAMDIARVSKELEKKNSYRVSYREKAANGEIRTMVAEYTLCDRKYGFCLLSVWDQEAMLASINHVADATSEAIK